MSKVAIAGYSLKKIQTKKYFLILLIFLFTTNLYSVVPDSMELKERDLWAEAKFEGKVQTEKDRSYITVIANHDEVQRNSRNGQPLKLGGTEYNRGLYCHANSKLIIKLHEAGKRFTAMVGVDDAAGPGSVIFSVIVKDDVKFRSEVLRGGGKPVAVDVDLAGAKEFILEANDAGDNISFDQSDWADAKVTLSNNQELWLGDIEIITVEKGYTNSAPFSFSYDGRPFAEIVSRFKAEVTQQSLDDKREKYIRKYTDSASGLEVRCEGIKYLDFPTVEWVVYFKNNGTEDTPILEDIQALDWIMERGTDGEFTLRYHIGGHSGPRDYSPQQVELTPTIQQSFTTWEGFPTANYLPFFTIQWQEEGTFLGVGWPARWAAQFNWDEKTQLQIRVGQEHTHFKLLPGEEVRSPLVVLLFWQGDRLRAQNLWRRWMMAHNMPRPGGELPQPLLEAASSGMYAEMVNANEENQKMFVDRYLEEGVKLDYWWMDAGWYPNKGNNWQDLLGTWEVDKKRFPNGLRAISEHAHEKGVKTLLWFEPERVVRDSWLFENHPEWLLGDGDSRFFNHGNPQANEWLTNRVDRILTDEKIDLYRQDFAVFSKHFWVQEDQKHPDRQGIAEIKHVMGYLKYLDELRRRHPNMLIDICAAGGKRLELENLRRAVPLWRSDYAFEPVGTQGHSYGLAQWLPYSGTGVAQVDVYAFRSDMCPSTVLNLDVRNKNLDYKLLQKLVKQWREVAPNYYGDFYPLTPYSLDNTMWMGWQYNRPEEGEGIVQMFCRTGTMYDSGLCKLKGLEPESRYEIHDFDQEGKLIMTGKELMEKGLRITFQNQPGAALIHYQKQ